MRSEVSIIVSSCDLFEDCWKPFIFGIQKYWQDCPYPIYIVSNNKEIDTPSGIAFIKVGEDKRFASNLKTALNQIDSEFVIYLQEDYWLTREVSNEAIEHHLNYCYEHQIDYLRLSFPYLKGENIDTVYYNNTLKQKYSLCLQAAIWKTSTLMALLRDGDSGWDFEYGIQQYALEKELNLKILGLNSEYKSVGLEYVRGTAVRKGRWTRAGVSYLNENDFGDLLANRNIEGPILGNLQELRGVFRPVALLIVKIMKILKVNI